MATKLQPGDLVTPRTTKTIGDSIPIYERDQILGSGGFWRPIGYARRGEIFILLEVRDSNQWRDGACLVKNPESGLEGWSGGQFLKRVR